MITTNTYEYEKYLCTKETLKNTIEQYCMKLAGF